MDFELKKLEKFLETLEGIRKYYDLKDLAPNAQPVEETLYDFAMHTIFEFYEVKAELDRNKLRCTTTIQCDNLREYYCDRLEYSFSDFVKKLDIAMELGNKEIQDFWDNEPKVNNDFRQENVIPLDKMSDLIISIQEVNELLKQMNPSLPDTEFVGEEIDFEPLEFVNLSQKLLLLESLGVLKAISETTGEEISSRKMGRIISDLLGTNDLTRHLRYFNPHSQPKDKNNPRTETNLSALHANLVKLKLPKLERVVEKELSKLYSEKD